MTKPLVYISGPFTSNPTENTHHACKLWHSLFLRGSVIPICPHWSLTQDLLTPLSHADWLGYDLGIVARCDAVLRMDGRSVGADMEVEFAKERRIPVFYGTRDLDEWVEQRKEA